MSDIDTEIEAEVDDGVAPTPVARPNVYGTDQAHELATHAVQTAEIPAPLGGRVSAGHRIVPNTKNYVLDTSVRRRVDRRKWF